MARVTTEDCIDKVSNRFELVMLAAFRARELSSGAYPTLERENDKNPVIALREIAEETQSADDLEERAIASHQTQNEIDEPEEGRMSLPTVGSYQDGEVTDEESLRNLMAGLRRTDS